MEARHEVPNAIGVSPSESINHKDAKRLFFEFVGRFLGVRITGVQQGFRQYGPSYLFDGPTQRTSLGTFPTTLAVDCNIMLEPQAIARAIVARKLADARKRMPA